MDKKIVTISMPKNSTQEEINKIRDQYNNYKVNIIISGRKNPEEIIKNFLKARLDA